jgi:predicted dithiol-disulfide oxidoreductase (DUF899 family)
MATIATEAKQHSVVSHQEWIAARKEFLQKEKEFTRQRDEISRLRRELPWERVEKRYEFEGPAGKRALADLFVNRGQLVVYHFMLGPGWKEGCPSCSYLADHFDGMTIHLAHRDITFAAVSHAPLAEIEAFKKRMGWKFPWYSSYGSDFNYDYQVSQSPKEAGKSEVFYNYEMMAFPATERPGLSVFHKDAGGQVFHTYSTYARGLDILVGTYNFLDMAPKGRDEAGLKHTMAWVRHHDKYEDGYVVDAGRSYIQSEVVKIETAGGKCCHE